MSSEDCRVGLAFRFVDVVDTVGSSIGTEFKSNPMLCSFAAVGCESLLSLLLVLSLLVFRAVVLLVVAVLEETDLSDDFNFFAGDVDLARVFASDEVVVVGGSKLGSTFAAAFVVVEFVVILKTSTGWSPRNASQVWDDSSFVKPVF